MADEMATLNVFYENWQEFMNQLSRAIAPLTPEQLTLRAAENERSIGEMAAHIAFARIDWFCDFMGVSDEAVAQYRGWSQPGEEGPVPTAADLVKGLDDTWAMMQTCFTNWQPDDLAHTYPMDWRGQHYDLTRSWVIWHVLEHDLQHAGEISLTLGMHGLPAPRA